jgi:hypothetical protein
MTFQHSSSNQFCQTLAIVQPTSTFFMLVSFKDSRCLGMPSLQHYYKLTFALIFFYLSPPTQWFFGLVCYNHSVSLFSLSSRTHCAAKVLPIPFWLFLQRLDSSFDLAK